MHLPSGPHIKPSREQFLEDRVRQLKVALDLAQQRITDLEKTLGIGDDITPLMVLGLTKKEAIAVNLLSRREVVTRTQVMTALYAEDDPGKQFEVQEKMADVIVSKARTKLKRVGVVIAPAGYSLGWRMLGPDKARLARLVASKAAMLSGRSTDQRQYVIRRQRASNGVSGVSNG